MHQRLRGVPPPTAELQFILDAQELDGYGREYYPVKVSHVRPLGTVVSAVWHKRRPLVSLGLVLPMFVVFIDSCLGFFVLLLACSYISLLVAAK